MTRRIFASLGALFLAAALPALAAYTDPVTINTNLPGPAGMPDNPGQFVANFYQFALLVGGLLAFAAIVYGGVVYTFSAGNPEKQSEGKDRITQALLGLLLLLGTYFLLNFINPDLVNLSAFSEATSALTHQYKKYPPPEPLRETEYQRELAATNANREQNREDTNNVLRLEQEGEELHNQADALEEEGAISGDEELLGLAKGYRQRAQEKLAEAAATQAQAITRNNSFYGAREEQAGNVEALKERKRGTDAFFTNMIRDLSAAGNTEGINAITSEKFIADANLDASIAAANLKSASAVDQANAVATRGFTSNNLSNAASAEAQKTIDAIAARAAALKKADPARADELQRAANAAVTKIKSACAQNNLGCKDYPANPNTPSLQPSITPPAAPPANLPNLFAPGTGR